jgi:hypothetical protein
VLGPDYFFGDPIQDHDNEEGFDKPAWMAKSKKQADECVPKWLEAVKEKFGLQHPIFCSRFSLVKDRFPVIRHNGHQIFRCR